MRKLIVSMNLTLDGYMSGPHCELDWHFESWTGDMAEAVATELADIDTMLLGHTTYTAMARHWSSMAQRLDCPREDIAFTELMNGIKKVVVSQKALIAKWTHTQVMDASLKNGIPELKKATEKNIMVYGSGKLVAGLQALDMIDEYQLWLHPVAIRYGKPLFRGLNKMHLERHRVFNSGVVQLVYRCDNRHQMHSGL